MKDQIKQVRDVRDTFNDYKRSLLRDNTSVQEAWLNQLETYINILPEGGIILTAEQAGQLRKVLTYVSHQHDSYGDCFECGSTRQNHQLEPTCNVGIAERLKEALYDTESSS